MPKNRVFIGYARIAALTIAVSPLSAQAPVSSFVDGTRADEAAIRAIVASQSASQEDPHVAPDLDWENAFGIRYTNLKKRNDWFEANVKPQFEDANNSSIEVKIRFLDGTVAVADEYWHVAGQVYEGQTKPGPDRWGRTTYIFKKENGAWTEVMERVADLRAAYFKHYDALPAAVPVSGKTLASYAGNYATGEGKQFASISVEGDHLVVQWHRGAFVGIPVSSTEFLTFNPNDLASYFKFTFDSASASSATTAKTTLAVSYADGELFTTVFRTQ